MNSTTVFTPVQMHLLKLFSYDSSEKHLEDIKVLLTKYFAEKLDTKLDSLWDSGQLNQDRLNEINAMDLHSDLK